MLNLYVLFWKAISGVVVQEDLLKIIENWLSCCCMTLDRKVPEVHKLQMFIFKNTL